MKIKAWSINIIWEDDIEEIITDVPDWVAKRIDQFLDNLEEEYEQ
tara:strand:- start:292 stop:426 length:135 start_codon:yes stop_codon:yes gene_type:complete